VHRQVFVLTPWDHQGRSLTGYRIGHSETGLKGRKRVSPHFRLEQFLCKQTNGTPQYVLVRPRLLQTLEKLLSALNERGYSLSTLYVMSGYRTTYYNRATGNITVYSRHLYGDAADIFVDADGDSWMDDLTGDGRAKRADARFLARVVRDIPTEGRNRFVGGLGIYGSASHRGPFVHVDLRGRQARW
jgi:hypothetical protein